MDIARIAPELRMRTRLMSLPLPIGSPLGRRVVRALVGRARTPDIAGVTIETPPDAPGIRLYRPDGAVRGALLWIHGGGYLIGSPAQDHRFCADTAREAGVLVASVGYRLAPEHRFPAPLDDCHAGWRWLAGAADRLGVDPARLAIAGQSAGGGLAAALVQRVHDGGGRPAAQWLFCPMLDDRTAARTDLDAVRHRLWSNRLNRIGWGAYLGRAPGAATLPDYAAAARRSDLSGLPPAWIGVGDIDLFHAEDRAYADRLAAAGVDVSFREVAGAPHGFEAWAATTTIARAHLAEARAWLAARIAG